MNYKNNNDEKDDDDEEQKFERNAYISIILILVTD